MSVRVYHYTSYWLPLLVGHGRRGSLSSLPPSLPTRLQRPYLLFTSITLSQDHYSSAINSILQRGLVSYWCGGKRHGARCIPNKRSLGALSIRTTSGKRRFPSLVHPLCNPCASMVHPLCIPCASLVQQLCFVCMPYFAAFCKFLVISSDKIESEKRRCASSSCVVCCCGLYVFNSPLICVFSFVFAFACDVGCERESEAFGEENQPGDGL